MSHPGKPAQPKADVTKLVAKLLGADEKTTVVYGFKTAFGGGRSTGFGLVYDDEDSMKKIEPKYRLIRLGLATKKTRSRKQWKDAKRKSKRTWGEWRVGGEGPVPIILSLVLATSARHFQPWAWILCVTSQLVGSHPPPPYPTLFFSLRYREEGCCTRCKEGRRQLNVQKFGCVCVRVCGRGVVGWCNLLVGWKKHVV